MNTTMSFILQFTHFLILVIIFNNVFLNTFKVLFYNMSWTQITLETGTQTEG
jgi:hypothetical protein